MRFYATTAAGAIEYIISETQKSVNTSLRMSDDIYPATLSGSDGRVFAWNKFAG